MVLSCLSFCFLFLFSQIGSYTMLLNCISSYLRISYSFSIDQNKAPPESFHIILCLLPENEKFLPFLVIWEQQQVFIKCRDFQRDSIWKQYLKVQQNYVFQNCIQNCKIHICCTSPVGLLYPKTFILSMHVSKTSQGLLLGTGTNCPAAHIQTAKPFHLSRASCLQPNSVWGWPLASVSPQMVPRHCLEKHELVGAGDVLKTYSMGGYMPVLRAMSCPCLT